MTELQEQVTELREEGKKKNAEVRQLAEENQRHIAKFRELMQQANESKHKRDALNNQVKEQLQKRRDLVELSRKLDAMLKEKEEALSKMPPEGRYSPSQLRRMIKEMEWRLQTEGMSPRDEKALSQDVNKLQKELDRMDKREPLLRDIYELRRQRHDLSLEFRTLDKTLESSREESDKLHQAVLDSYKQADDIKAKITAYLSVIGEKSKEADEVFAKLRGTHEEMEAQDRAHAQEHSSNKRQKEAEKQLSLDERARVIYDNFKNGKKISMEDLQVLQASGIEI